MKRYCVVAEIKPEHVDEYIDIHKNAWPDLLKAIEESGCKNMLIFYYKNQSIIFYECEDIDTFYEKFGKTEVAGRWNDKVHVWFAESPNLKGTGKVETLEKVFDLQQQLAGKLEAY